MTTPTYQGSGQPRADNGLWSGLGSWLGGSTPAYAGDGQPSPGTSGFLGSSTPAYKSAPSSIPFASALASGGFPPGPFAIVVPRGFPPPGGMTDPQQ